MDSDSFDYFCKEFFDDNEILEVCGNCLKIRVASLIWAKLNQNILEFFLKIKQVHTLTMCPNCLQEQYDSLSQLKHKI